MDIDNKQLSITDALPENILEGLSDVHKEELQKKLDQIVESKVHDQLDVAIKSATTSYDGMVNERLEKLVVRMEEAYTLGLQQVIEKLRANEKKHVQQVKEHYVGIIKKNKEIHQKKLDRLHEQTDKAIWQDTVKFRNDLTESVKKYIDSKVDSLVPVDEIRSAVKNTAAMKLVESFKHLLNVNQASASKSLRKPLQEAYQYANDAEEENKGLVAENNDLRKQLDESKQEMENMKRDAFLNEKLLSVPSIDQRNYLRRVMKDASIEWIKENFDYSKRFFVEAQQNESAALAQKTIAQRKSLVTSKKPVNRKTLGEAITLKNNPKKEVKEEPKTPLNEHSSQISQIIAAIESDQQDWV